MDASTLSLPLVLFVDVAVEDTIRVEKDMLVVRVVGVKCGTDIVALLFGGRPARARTVWVCSSARHAPPRLAASP